MLTAKETEELKVDWDPRKFEAWAIEPYGNRVVAFTRSRDKTLLATVFCRKDHVPRLLFTNKFSFEGMARVTNAIAGLKEIEIFALHYPKASITPRQTPGGVRYEVVLTGFNPLTLVGSKAIGIQGDIYRADADFLAFQFSPENAVKTMAVALRNCI